MRAWQRLSLITNVLSLQKRRPICDGQVFFIDSRLLMGAYVESCLGQMQVGINRSKVSFQGIADLVSIKGYS